MEQRELRIPTFEELEIVNDYLEEQEFSEAKTNDEVMGLFLVMVGYGLEPEKAIKNISSFVAAMQNEYHVPL